MAEILQQPALGPEATALVGTHGGWQAMAGPALPAMAPPAASVDGQASEEEARNATLFLGLPNLIPAAGEGRRAHSGDLSEGPSESSANRETTETEDDDFQSTIPHLERFYEQLAAKARLPGHVGHPNSSSWVLSLARSYRRLSKDKRRRGRLRSLLQSAAQQAVAQAQQGGQGAASASALACPVREQPGWSSNTDDSGYEAGYEDGDESELSEWESGGGRRGHKRKLEALVHLTMRLGFSEGCCSESAESEGSAHQTQPPPLKTPRTPCGTQPAGVRLPLPRAGDDGPAPSAPARPPTPTPLFRAVGTPNFPMAPAWSFPCAPPFVGGYPPPAPGTASASSGIAALVPSALVPSAQPTAPKMPDSGAGASGRMDVG